MIFQSSTKSHENKNTRYRISRRIDWRPPQMPKIGQKSFFRKISKKCKSLPLIPGPYSREALELLVVACARGTRCVVLGSYWTKRLRYVRQPAIVPSLRMCFSCVFLYIVYSLQLCCQNKKISNGTSYYTKSSRSTRCCRRLLFIINFIRDVM